MNDAKFPPEDPNRPTESSNHTDESGCDTAGELVAAYSIGATDPEEVAFVQKQLAVCPETTQELVQYGRLAEALLHSVPPVAPPPALADRLLRALGPAPLLPRQPLPARVQKERKPAVWRWGMVWVGAAAAAIILLTALNLYWVQQNLLLRQQIDQLVAERAADKQAENGILVLLASDERQAIELPAAQEDSQANAEVLWDPDVSVAMLYAKAFPALPPDQVYQLWLTSDGQRQSGGLFTVDHNGTGVLLFPIAQPLDNLESMGITPEPAGGSPGPTSPPVVRRRFNSS